MVIYSGLTNLSRVTCRASAAPPHEHDHVRNVGHGRLWDWLGPGAEARVSDHTHPRLASSRGHTYAASMADTRAPRPSTDEGTSSVLLPAQLAMSLLSPDIQFADTETAPLLQNVSHPDGEALDDEQPTFLDRLSAIVQEPLSPLTQILLVATLVFLILSSVFIGLFAGAQHKLNSGGAGGKTTVVVTATTTAQVTTTAITTTTVAVPAPGPTTPPPEVRDCSCQCPPCDTSPTRACFPARMHLSFLHQPRLLRALFT